MPLHYVDPHNEHGRRYRAVASFGRSRPGQFVSRHVFFRIETQNSAASSEKPEAPSALAALSSASHSWVVVSVGMS